MHKKESQKNLISRKNQGDNGQSPSASYPSTIPKAVSELTLEKILELAFSNYHLGHFSQAEKLARVVLHKAPRQLDALQLLGATLNQTGRYCEAIRLLRQAAGQQPGCAHLHNNLATALHRLGKPQEAVSELNTAIQIRPDFAKAYNNLAAALMELGNIDQAIGACEQAITLRSDFKEAYNNLGLAQKKKGQLQKAVASYEKAIEIDPEYAKAFTNLGIALAAQDKLEQAARNAQKAVSLVQNSPELHCNLGLVYNRQGRFEQAVAESQKAITLRPQYVQAYNNLGTALMELGKFSEANAAFERAISIHPDCAQAHHNRALVLLLTGQFEDGWDEYEWRWRNESFSTPIRPFPQQWWDGATQDIKKLLVWGEQGIGDEVQFAGLIRHIADRGIQVFVECDKRLVPLLRRSFPDATVLERTNPPLALLKEPSITHQIPMTSIPSVLGLTPNSIALEKPFIVPDKQKRDRFRSEYKANTDKLLVGISFTSANTQEGRKRSIALKNWGPILKVEGTQFVNLQYGDCSRDLQEARKRFGVEIFQDERVDPLKDLENFAAQVAALDLVISVDNSTVHFAGALGIEVWTLLPTVPDWRWMTQGDRTHWYPTMSLFRQAQRGNWEPVISRVAAKLTSLVSANTSEDRSSSVTNSTDNYQHLPPEATTS